MSLRSVLVVDDDHACAEVVGDALRAAGHRVAIANDAAGARLQLERERPGIVLIDSFLGPVEGIELVRSLRRGPLASTPVVLTTGRPLAVVWPLAWEAGIRWVLEKPIELESLLKAVSAAGD